MCQSLQLLFRMKVTTFTLLVVSAFSSVGSTMTALLETRQAIPVAIVQSKALTGHAIANKTKTNTGNDWCNRTSPYCDPFITNQYKLDQEMKNIPSSFNITDSTYNASIVHALASNKTTVTRNKTIVFLQNQGAQQSIIPAKENFQTLKQLINYTIPLNNTITNRTIYIPPSSGSLKQTAVQDRSQNVNVPFSQNGQNGKIVIPSFVSKTDMPELIQTNNSLSFDKVSNDIAQNTNHSNIHMPGDSDIHLIENIREPTFAPYSFNQTSHKVPVIHIEVKTQAPMRNVVNLTVEVPPPLNNTPDKGEMSVNLYGNNNSGYIGVNTTQDKNMPPLENAMISAQPDYVSLPETNIRYAPSVSNRSAYAVQENSTAEPQNIKHLERLNITLNNYYGLYITSPTFNISSNTPPNSLPASRRSILTKTTEITTRAMVTGECSRRCGMHTRDDIRRPMEVATVGHKRGRTRKKGNLMSRAHPYRKGSIKKRFYFKDRYSWRRERGDATEVSVLKDLESRFNHRIKRYAFDSDSENDDYGDEIPVLFPAATDVSSTPIVTYDMDDSGNIPIKTSRSEISQPSRGDYERFLSTTDDINYFVRRNHDINDFVRPAHEINDYVRPNHDMNDFAGPINNVNVRPDFDDNDFAGSNHDINDFLRPNNEINVFARPDGDTNDFARPEHNPNEFIRPNLVDINAYQRGRIEIPDNLNYQPIGEPAKRMIDQLLTGKSLDRTAENDFFRLPSPPHQDDLPYKKSPPKLEPATMRNEITRDGHSNSKDDTNPVLRSEEDKIKDEEMGMILDRFDQQTRKIANLYKYLDPDDREGKNIPLEYNDHRESQHYALNDPQNAERSPEVGKGWMPLPYQTDRSTEGGKGPSTYQTGPQNANLKFEIKHDPRDIVRNTGESRAWESSSYHPDTQNTNLVDGVTHDPQTIARNTENDKGWRSSLNRHDHSTPHFIDEIVHGRDKVRERTELRDDFNPKNQQEGGQDRNEVHTSPDIESNSGRRNMVDNPSEPVRYNRDEIMRELLNYVKHKQQEALFQIYPQATDSANQLSEHIGNINSLLGTQQPSRETNSNQNVAQVEAINHFLKSVAEAYKSRNGIPQDSSANQNKLSLSLPLQDASMDFPSSTSFAQLQEKKETVGTSGIQDDADLVGHNSIANEKGVVMLLIATPKSIDDDETSGRKEKVEHKELTQDGMNRIHFHSEDNGNKEDNEDDDFSKNLKEATNLVLGDELKAGNITTEQRNDIETKLSKILDLQHNKTGDKVKLFTKDTHDIVGDKKSKTPKVAKTTFMKLKQAPTDPVMYLSFESTIHGNSIPDNSGNRNHAKFEASAGLSKRKLGTCGKAADINDGSITWRGSKFQHKPEKAITIAMWVKAKKSGVINWFANGKEGSKMFETKSKGTAVPAKVWTHVAGTFESITGKARIFINGNLEQEVQKHGARKLAKNWLVNGIGGPFGDDSLQYVDEVFVYDRALNNSEVKTLAKRCIFNRMILHYGFEDGNKTNVHDQSGLENNGILTGGAFLTRDCNRCGYCMDLQAGPDPSMKIQQISVENLPRIKVTIAVWISLNDTKGVHNIFKTESGKGNVGYHLQVKNGKVRWYIASDKGHTILDNSTRDVVIPESLWTHIIVSFNNENGLVNIFVNSILKFKDNVPAPRKKYLPINWDNDASIGDSSYHGYLDEFIMYNWELDNSEVLYVRNYCADHPKLVRFTVRVPLVKKTEVPRTPKTAKVDTNRRPKWWTIYKRLLNKRNAVSKRTLRNDVSKRTLKTLKNFQQSLSTAYPLLK